MNSSSNSFDKLFQSSHLKKEKTSLFRTMSLLLVFLSIASALVDYALSSADLADIILVRGVVVTTMLFILTYSYHHSFTKYYDLVFSAIFILAAIGIEVMIYLAAFNEQSTSVYLTSLLLLIMVVFSWSYLMIISSVLTSAIIISSYALLAWYIQLPVSEIMMNLFFLLSASGIGFISQSIRNRYLKNSYKLQESLRLSVEEKKMEANHDVLTGLPNRRYMTLLLEESLKKVMQKKTKTLVLMFIDLNGFKKINDKYGHEVGDKVLIIVARRLSLAIRADDSISRFGGDEYVIGLMVKNNHIMKIEKIAEKFSDTISAPMRINNIKITVGSSIGVAIHPIHGKTIPELINNADKEMYFVKHKGIVKTKAELSLNKENTSESEVIQLFK